MHLLDADRSIITSGAWINAAIINASQFILNKQFDASFQDVGCGITMSFSITDRSFIQILHDSNRNHRVMISNIASNQPEDLLVYDSLFS